MWHSKDQVDYGLDTYMYKYVHKYIHTYIHVQVYFALENKIANDYWPRAMLVVKHLLQLALEACRPYKYA